MTMMKRILPLLIILAIAVATVASCTRPALPEPPDMVMFEGTGCDDLNNGGPWCLPFPRIIA